MAPGSHRVVVLEADGRVARKDFGDLAEACRYADDAAWETDDGPVFAYVVDEAMQVVHRGGRRGSGNVADVGVRRRFATRAGARGDRSVGRGTARARGEGERIA